MYNVYVLSDLIAKTTAVFYNKLTSTLHVYCMMPVYLTHTVHVHVHTGVCTCTYMLFYWVFFVLY